jgi:hypothetical protein
MSPTFRRDLLDFDHFHTKAIVLVLFLFHSAFQQLKVVSAYSGTRCLLLLTLQANHALNNSDWLWYCPNCAATQYI